MRFVQSQLYGTEEFAQIIDLHYPPIEFVQWVETPWSWYDANNTILSLEVGGGYQNVLIPTKEFSGRKRLSRIHWNAFLDAQTNQILSIMKEWSVDKMESLLASANPFPAYKNSYFPEDTTPISNQSKAITYTDFFTNYIKNNETLHDVMRNDLKAFVAIHSFYHLPSETLRQFNDLFGIQDSAKDRSVLKVLDGFGFHRVATIPNTSVVPPSQTADGYDIDTIRRLIDKIPTGIGQDELERAMELDPSIQVSDKYNIDDFQYHQKSKEGHDMHANFIQLTSGEERFPAARFEREP